MRHNHPAWGRDKVHNDRKPDIEDILERCAYCYGPIPMRGYSLPTNCPQCGLTIKSDYDIV